MIHLECVQTYQYIKCFDQESGNLIFCHNYRLYPDRADLADITIDPEMKIQWQEPYLPNSDFEISIKYRPFSRRHESFKEVTISKERILDNALCIGKVLDEILGLTYIANIFKDKGAVEFPFTIFIRESVNLGRLRAEELIKIDIDGDNQQENVVISNNLADIKILDYPYTLGDLEKRIIWNIRLIDDCYGKYVLQFYTC